MMFLLTPTGLFPQKACLNSENNFIGDPFQKKWMLG